jgi:hypothetical protein
MSVTEGGNSMYSPGATNVIGAAGQGDCARRRRNPSRTPAPATITELADGN